MSLEDTLASIHEEFAEKMLLKVKSKDVTAQELSVIRQFLKDNDITSARSNDPKNPKPIEALGDLVPFPTKPVSQAGGE